MKTKFLFAFLIGILLTSCKKDNEVSKISNGSGFEIYETTKPYSGNLNLDYSKVNFDTITLSEKPILYYKDLINYDTINHKLTLGLSHDSLKFNNAGVYGRMIVVTLDKIPIYCGFKWRVISSVPSNWIFIEEPYQSLDNLADNEIVISYRAASKLDPRLDKRIIGRLKSDNKIKK